MVYYAIKNMLYVKTLKAVDGSSRLVKVTAGLNASANISNVTLNGTIATATSALIKGNSQTDGYLQIPPHIRVIALVFCSAIMLFGLIGNLLVSIVILKTKDMRNSTNIFLMNLSIADLLVLLVCTPTMLVEVNSRPETWVLGKEMCKLVPFVELTVAHTSVLTILAISFERYYAICKPLKAGYICTNARAILICIISWVAASLFTSPILFFSEHKTEEYIDGTFVSVCLTQAQTIWTVGFFLMTTFIFFILPVIILIVIYIAVARDLIATNDRMVKIRPNKPELSYKARKQVVLMLGVVVCSFFICLLPFRVLTLWIILGSHDAFLNIRLETYYNILYFCRIMLYINSAINPILYNIMSSKFRKGFLKLCFCWRVCNSKLEFRVGVETGLPNTTTSVSAQSQTFNRRVSDSQTGMKHINETDISQIITVRSSDI